MLYVEFYIFDYGLESISVIFFNLTICIVAIIVDGTKAHTWDQARSHLSLQNVYVRPVASWAAGERNTP